MEATGKGSVKLVLCWHMHQPDYRDHIQDEFQQPWVYLHAIRDYLDMAAHLEDNPEARAVVNFSPILLEQLDLYERQLAGFLNDSAPIRDPLLATLAAPVYPADAAHRLALIKHCLRANRRHQIERFPEYHRLAKLAELIFADMQHLNYLNEQYLADLVTWYHLAWMGETVRRSHDEIRQLIEQGSRFTYHQRRRVVEIAHGCIAGIRQRYRRLAESGRVELAMSPYAHPMVPLLLDFQAAREAQPDVLLPGLSQYPGGEARVRWHFARGLQVFQDYFGIRPAGCWPSEGGLSSASLDLIAGAGFRWTATGENVIRNSLGRGAEHGHEGHIYRPYLHRTSGIHLFGRDDALSDLIGFTYSDWHADDAVANLIHRLETIARSRQSGEDLVISIIMDGENAWEYYPENGYYFISSLYRRLSSHPLIKLATYSDVIGAHEPREIKSLVAGSWVYGNFSTWIGDKDKNRAWDILCDAKRACDEVMREHPPDERQREMIERQLAACEGSDWCWWFGDYNPEQTVSDFDRLYRTHLANLYQMLGREPPAYLTEIIGHGTGAPVLGGVIRRGTTVEDK